jgi:hypothetical protein
METTSRGRRLHRYEGPGDRISGSGPFGRPGTEIAILRTNVQLGSTIVVRIAIMVAVTSLGVRNGYV